MNTSLQRQITPKLGFAFKSKFICMLLSFFCAAILNSQIRPPEYNTQLISGGSTTVLQSGKKYYLDSNLTLDNLSIQNNAKLWIDPGVILNLNGNFDQAGGLVTISSLSGIKMTGSASFGAFGSQNNAMIKILPRGFLSVTGSLAQQDPSFNGFYQNGKAVFELSDGSVVEICGTFTQQSTTYPLINYVGNSQPSYMINKAQVNGAIGSILTSDSNINWITMNSVSQLLQGSANWSGEFATPQNTIFWPEGLSDNMLNCGSAYDIIINQPSDTCTKNGNFTAGGTPSKFGITTSSKTENWPFNIPNGQLVLESQRNGLVISRVQNTDKIIEPKKGMLIYDISSNCVKLFNGSFWNCIKRSCNN